MSLHQRSEDVGVPILFFGSDSMTRLTTERVLTRVAENHQYDWKNIKVYFVDLDPRSKSPKDFLKYKDIC